MTDFRFKDLTVDNAFDFCEVLAVIGVEQVIGIFDKDEIQQLQESGTDMKEVGIVIAMKVCGILIKNISKARNEIYSFFAGCTEHDDGTKVTVDELKEMKFADFIKIVRAFFGTAEIIAFENSVADALGVSADQEEQEQTTTEIPTV